MRTYKHTKAKANAAKTVGWLRFRGSSYAHYAALVRAKETLRNFVLLGIFRHELSILSFFKRTIEADKLQHRSKCVHPPASNVQEDPLPNPHGTNDRSLTEQVVSFYLHTLNKQASRMGAIRTCPLLRDPWQLCDTVLVVSHTTQRVGASSSKY